MTDTPQVLLAHHLKTLKLPTFLREYDKIARQCASEGVDHVRYLLRLAELELIDRERRMVERRINSNALRHGLYSAKAISERRELAALMRSMRGLVKEVVGPVRHQNKWDC